MTTDRHKRCVCLDAEFVEGDEIIEISIFALDRTQLFHHLFRPAGYSSWDSSIHHITPGMVSDAPSFEALRPEIQDIRDSADHLIGFAVDNDITHLSHQGIRNLSGKHIIELRNWFWINHGLQNGLDLFQKVSLASVTEHLGVSFGEEGMHSAAGDTRATLDCFRMLYDRFCSANSLDPEDFEGAMKAFDDIFIREKLEYDRTHAEGYALLLRVGQGYALRIKREEPRPGGRIEACISVADRHKAGIELHNMMARRAEISKGVFRLTPADIEEFRNYANGFDADDHNFFKKLQGLSARYNVSGLKRR